MGAQRLGEFTANGILLHPLAGRSAALDQAGKGNFAPLMPSGVSLSARDVPGALTISPRRAF